MGVQRKVKARTCTRFGQLIEFGDELEWPEIVARDSHCWITRTKRLTRVDGRSVLSGDDVEIANAYSFDFLCAQIKHIIQRPSRIRRRLAIASNQLEFPIRQQQIDATPIYEIDVVCPSVFLDEPHERRYGVSF